MKKLFTISLGVILLGLVTANAEDAKKEHKKGEAKHEVSAKMLEKFDKNKNGTLEADEKEAMKKDREETMKKFDKNGDGKLDETERAAAKEAGKEHHKKKEDKK